MIIRCVAALSSPQSPVSSTWQLHTVRTNKYRLFRIRYSFVFLRAFSVSDKMSPAVVRSGQTAALWCRGGDLMSRTGASGQLSCTLGGTEVSLRGGERHSAFFMKIWGRNQRNRQTQRELTDCFFTFTVSSSSVQTCGILSLHVKWTGGVFKEFTWNLHTGVRGHTGSL